MALQAQLCKQPILLRQLMCHTSQKFGMLGITVITVIDGFTRWQWWRRVALACTVHVGGLLLSHRHFVTNMVSRCCILYYVCSFASEILSNDFCKQCKSSASKYAHGTQQLCNHMLSGLSACIPKTLENSAPQCGSGSRDFTVSRSCQVF